MAVETFDLSEEFKLDEILEEKQNENDNNFRPPLKKATGSEIAESRKILKKIGHRKTEEEIKRTSELIIQISRFRDSSRFAAFLTSLGFNLNPSHLKTMEIGELEDLLTELKCAIQNKNGSKIIDEGYFMALSMVENISKHPKFQAYMDLQGLSANARQNDELLDTLETLNLMYSNFGSMQPEQKLLFLTGGLILRTSSVNKMLHNIKKYEESLKNQVDTNPVIKNDVNQSPLITSVLQTKQSDEKEGQDQMAINFNIMPNQTKNIKLQENIISFDEK